MLKVKNIIVKFELGNVKGKFVKGSLENLSSEEINGYIGRSHQLTAETVKMIFGVGLKEYQNILEENDIYVNYSDNSTYWSVIIIKN